MDEDISPALKKENHSELSTEEFQIQLYHWFEDKGLLDDLRTHLRTNMIKVLQDTSIGKPVVITEISPKLQALNLLIAEYLLNKDYHYSLSVFRTEVSISNAFPILTKDSKQKDLNKFRFTDNDTWDILETLGFIQPTHESSEIYSRYLNSSTDSLLNCILTIYSSNTNINTNLNAPSTSSTKQKQNSIALEQFVRILQDAKIHPTIILKIIHELKNVITTEIELIKDCKDKEYLLFKNKLEENTTKKLDKYKKRVKHMQEKYELERQKLEKQLAQAKANLNVCSKSLQDKFIDLNEYENNLKQFESEINQQKHDLSKKGKAIQGAIESKLIDEAKLKAESIEKNITEKLMSKFTSEQIKSGVELAQQNCLIQDRVSLIERAQQTTENTDLQNVLLRQNAQQLQLEMSSLREQNSTYLSRIQELAVRTNSLIQELEDSRQRVQELDGFQRTLGVIAPPLLAPSVPSVSYRARYGIASYNGGGEEGSNVPPLAQRQFRNIASNRELRRRLQPRKTSQTHNTSSSEEVSPTENILKEARQRLHDLEQESDVIDRHFQQYRSRDDIPNAPSQSKSNIMEQFNKNVENCRDSISRIFKNNYDMNQPSTSSQVFNYVPSSNTANISFKNIPESNERMHVRNLVADVPLNIDDSDIEEVFQCLHLQRDEEQEVVSGQSSAFVVNTSFSTVEVSSDNKSSDEDQLQKLQITEIPEIINTIIENVQIDENNDPGKDHKVWDYIGVTCLFAYILELILVR